MHFHKDTLDTASYGNKESHSSIPPQSVPPGFADRGKISLSSNKRKSAAIRSALSHTSIDKILISYFIQSRNRNLLMFPNTCLFYLCTRPEASPPASFFTSSTLTMLKSPSMECFKQLAATANSIVSCWWILIQTCIDQSAAEESPPPTRSTICIKYSFEK